MRYRLEREVPASLSGPELLGARRHLVRLARARGARGRLVLDTLETGRAAASTAAILKLTLKHACVLSPRRAQLSAHELAAGAQP